MTKINNFRAFLKRNRNLNLTLSTIALVLIWRGVWSLTDLFLIYEFDINQFWSYLIPTLIGFAYLYLNDLKLTELSHPNETA